MFEDDTIAAISTALGEGGIGIVRISGKAAFEIADSVFRSARGKVPSHLPSHSIIHGEIIDPATGSTIDEVLLSAMRAPNTYTREDTVEINCHGGMLPLRKVLDLILEKGARMANPGEFTQRAFINGRIDLVQAEAVMDVIRSKTDASRKVALEQLSGGLSGEITDIRDILMNICAHIEAYLDFPEDEIEMETEVSLMERTSGLLMRLDRLYDTYEDGRFFREGLSVAIVGRPNVGKSSLLNTLLERDRAIVTDIPGTTRDVIEEYLNVSGLPVRVIDTAGIRESHDAPEQEGVKRSLRAIDEADLVLAIFDGSDELHDDDLRVIERLKSKNTVHVLNKSDLGISASNYEMMAGEKPVKISAKLGEGIEDLKEAILKRALRGDTEMTEGIMVTNIRHRISIGRARDAIMRGLESFKEKRPLEVVTVDLRDALQNLGEIIGTVTTEDILNRIFDEFCIGK
ncbi:MAG: tRNA uridine-5-carboxymethylaminomethyl(34) synthesis GTPase MnmE [Nitrospirota bacterium]|nr:MAG: tRNA uridine-5-carboxymethylaminomethyl(34) synthesis GTPase MnmE [Nitrospirota bacterium]